MSATNATPIINLPLFIGTDKPAWLTDWNGAMNIIDTSIAALQTAEAGTASSLATLAQSVTALSGTVEQHTTALQTVTEATATNTGSINSINSLIGNGTPTTTDQTIIGAINELNASGATTDLSVGELPEGVTACNLTNQFKSGKVRLLSMTITASAGNYTIPIVGLGTNHLLSISQSGDPDIIPFASAAGQQSAIFVRVGSSGANVTRLNLAVWY